MHANSDSVYCLLVLEVRCFGLRFVPTHGIGHGTLEERSMKVGFGSSAEEQRGCLVVFVSRH